jgi:hypothetical protein
VPERAQQPAVQYDANKYTPVPVLDRPGGMVASYQFRNNVTGQITDTPV